ncbi:MAG TPA: HAD family phosphatase [Chitinophagaceae bacterium]|nr:HAD family phosphatase [Chitinophagaceae bacterium]
MSRGFIFDMNGTMIDDMSYHTKAWFDILNNDLQANMSWDAVKEQMYGKNQELLLRVFGRERFSEEEMEVLSLEKEKRYQAAYQPELRLIDGLDSFLERSQNAGVKLSIGSAAIKFNVDFVLDGLNIRHYFDVVVCADDVAISKPDPDTFLKAAAAMELQTANCIVFEDAPKGVEAAHNAGMKAVVLTTMHNEEEFQQYTNVLMFVKNYHDVRLHQLLA